MQVDDDSGEPMTITHKRKQRAFKTLQALLRVTGTKQRVHWLGNRVQLYEHGGDFFTALFQQIATATTSIQAEFYIIKADSTGQQFARLLVEAAARGVGVALIYDYVGCYETPSSYFKQMERAGVRCLAFNVPAFSRLHWLDRRDHRKMVIIDGHTAFLGGMNVGDAYAGFGENLEPWRDVGLCVQGPAVEEIQGLFGDTWRMESGDTLPVPASGRDIVVASGDADVMIVNGAPHHTRSVIRSAFRLAMAGARRSIRIMTPYFLPGPRMVRALLRAHKMGVRVQMILPSISDVPLVKLISLAYLTPLVQAGIEVYERQDVILHAKVMLIDDTWVTLGSANLDHRSFHRNFEINVVVASHDFGIQVWRMFDEDLAKSRRVEVGEYEPNGWMERLLIWLLAPLRRFL